jgi:hypothetical protein
MVFVGLRIRCLVMGEVKESSRATQAAAVAAAQVARLNKKRVN